MTSKAKDIIRIGDKVKVVNPIKFIRVGYDLSFQDECDKVEANEETVKAVWSFLCENTRNVKPFEHWQDRRVFNKVVSALAYAEVLRKADRGGDRNLFTRPFGEEDPTGQESRWQEPVVGTLGEVEKIKIVKTGSYTPASAYYSYNDGSYDYEPAIFYPDKTYKVLTIDFGGYGYHQMLSQDVIKVNLTVSELELE